jgi:hypothetical protein
MEDGLNEATLMTSMKDRIRKLSFDIFYTFFLSSGIFSTFFLSISTFLRHFSFFRNFFRHFSFFLSTFFRHFFAFKVEKKVSTCFDVSFFEQLRRDAKGTKI